MGFKSCEHFHYPTTTGWTDAQQSHVHQKGLLRMPVVRRMLTYIRMQNVIKLYHAVQKLRAFSLNGTGRTDRLLQGPRHEKTCLRGFANNTGDQPAHPRRLISTFVIRILESILYGLATGQISSF